MRCVKIPASVSEPILARWLTVCAAGSDIPEGGRNRLCASYATLNALRHVPECREPPRGTARAPGLLMPIGTPNEIEETPISTPTSEEEVYSRGYPAREVLDRIGDKWTILVMRSLQNSTPARYTELERRLPGISRKMLTQTLRATERDGMVQRTILTGKTPHTEYSLTRLGLSALEPIDVLSAWSRKHMCEVRRARSQYRDEPAPWRENSPTE
jgi:DNA-binding HxlR family transcriptional regulator